jgi:hypothetical protein
VSQQQERSSRYKFYRFLVLAGLMVSVAIAHAFITHKALLPSTVIAVIGAFGGTFYYELMHRNRDKILASYSQQSDSAVSQSTNHRSA